MNTALSKDTEQFDRVVEAPIMGVPAPDEPARVGHSDNGTDLSKKTQDREGERLATEISDAKQLNQNKALRRQVIAVLKNRDISFSIYSPEALPEWRRRDIARLCELALVPDMKGPIGASSWYLDVHNVRIGLQRTDQARVALAAAVDKLTEASHAIPEMFGEQLSAQTSRKDVSSEAMKQLEVDVRKAREKVDSAIQCCTEATQVKFDYEKEEAALVEKVLNRACVMINHAIESESDKKENPGPEQPDNTDFESGRLLNV